MGLRSFATVFAAVALASVLQAADPTGTIAGSIQDPSGAPVANSRVTVTALSTGLTRETTSRNDGAYVFPLLPVGTYGISVTATGFERLEQRGIEVRADQNANVPISLRIGSSTQSVTVEANAQMVETRSGALSQVISQQKIIDLPLNGRNAADLILLTPGANDLGVQNAPSSAAGDTVQSVSFPDSKSISSNGARADMVNYNMDGGSNQDPYTNTNNPFPNPDAIEEFSVQSNSYSAEYGRGAGAIVNIVTKSGTNQFHGSAFDFLRNGDLNARNFFASAPDQLKQNQFGGSIGGPILKDKLFFFGTYQGTQSRDISLGNSTTVPTVAERNGDFSGLSTQLVNPYTGAPYPGNQIPASQFAPASQKILALVPLPQDGSQVVHYSLPNNESQNQFLTRVDYNLRSSEFMAAIFTTATTKTPLAARPTSSHRAAGSLSSIRALR